MAKPGMFLGESEGSGQGFILGEGPRRPTSQWRLVFGVEAKLFIENCQ